MRVISISMNARTEFLAKPTALTMSSKVPAKAEFPEMWLKIIANYEAEKTALRREIHVLKGQVRLLSKQGLPSDFENEEDASSEEETKASEKSRRNVTKIKKRRLNLQRQTFPSSSDTLYL